MKRAAEYLKRNSYIYITAFVLFAIGVCIGALGAAGIEDGEFSPLKEYAESFFGSAQKIAHAEVFKKCAVKNLGLVSVCGICVRFAVMCHKNKIRRKKELVPFALSMSAMWAAMSIIDLTDSFVSEFVARGIF